MTGFFLPRIAAAVCLVLASPALWAAGKAVGTIQYLEGGVSVTRAGAVLANLDVGDTVENYDLIKTSPNGSAVIALDKGTGMNGTLTVKPKSVFTLKTETVQGTPATEGEMLAGSVAVKAKKLGGDPSLRIRTTGAVMGVRGTQFEVTISVNDSLLVGCSEGKVECAGADGDTLFCEPGNAVVRPAGESFKSVPVAVSDLETFKKDWNGEEIEAFKASAVSVLDQYSKLYRSNKGKFKAASDALASDAALKAWISDSKQGKIARSNEPENMKRKASVAPKIQRIRSILFIFEKVYYRLDEARGLMAPGTLNDKLSSGSVKDLFREMDADKGDFEKRVAFYRYALKLFAERNEGRLPTDLGASSDGSFFDDTSDFFKD